MRFELEKRLMGGIMKLTTVAVSAVAVAGLGLGLGACSTSGTSPPQHITIQQQNNPPPSTPATPPTPPAVTVTPSLPPVTTQACSNDPSSPLPYCTAPNTDPWSVAVAYTSDITSGDNWDAWNLLSPSMQNQGWGGSYATFVANFDPLGFDNVTEVSESGDTVTFTYNLNNTDTGTLTPHTCTYTVDNGLITSSAG